MQNAERVLGWVLVLSIVFLYLFRLDLLPLFFEEPRRAIVALEMMLSKNYWIPKINGFNYYNKPPVYNWLLIVLFDLFGTHNWVVRLPTVLSAWGMGLLTYFFFRNKIGVHTAKLAAFMTVTTAHMLFYFSFTGEIDMTYSLLIYLQFLLAIHFYRHKKFVSLYGWTYLLTAVGFLMKGFPSIAFQGLTLIGLAIAHRNLRFFLHPAHFLFGLGAVGIMCGYFWVYSGQADPLVYLANLLNESSRRTTTGGLPKYLLSLIKVPGEFLKITFPWCLLLLALRWKELRSNVTKNPWIQLVLIVLAANVWLYWLSPGTKDRYLYMFLPMIMTPLAFFMNEMGKPKIIKGIAMAIWGIIILGCVAAGIYFENSWPYAMLCLVILTAFIVFHQKFRWNPVYLMLGSMLIGRLTYGLVVFPDRYLGSSDYSHKDELELVLDTMGPEPLFFHNKVNDHPTSLPFFGEQQVPRIARLPYDFSYYYSSKTQRILTFTPTPVPGAYHITHWSRWPKDAEVLLQFEMEDLTWTLFKMPD